LCGNIKIWKEKLLYTLIRRKCSIGSLNWRVQLRCSWFQKKNNCRRRNKIKKYGLNSTRGTVERVSNVLDLPVDIVLLDCVEILFLLTTKSKVMVKDNQIVLKNIFRRCK